MSLIFSKGKIYAERTSSRKGALSKKELLKKRICKKNPVHENPHHVYLLIICPILVIIQFIDAKINSMEVSPALKAYEKSGITLVEAVESMKTIQS